MIDDEAFENAAKILNQCLVLMHNSGSGYNFDQMTEALSVEPSALADFLYEVVPGNEPPDQKIAYAFFLGLIAGRQEG